MKFLEGYRRLAGGLLLVLPAVLGFFGVSLPEGALKDILHAVDLLLGSVLLILSARNPAPSVIEKQ